MNGKCSGLQGRDVVEVRFRQVGTVEEFISFWPFLVRCEPGVDKGRLLKNMMAAVNCGLLLVVYVGPEIKSFCTVIVGPDGAHITSIPQDYNMGIGRECLKVVRKWAKDHGLKKLLMVTNKLSGSSFRYLEKSLGFHRESMTFSMEV